MLVEIGPLWNCFLQCKEQSNPLVLATLVESQGSSYKKKGAMMLIETDKTTHGLLSGGCLEADIAEHAMQVFSDQHAIVLTYDLADDSIFGLGAGCDGSITILLILLNDDYSPLQYLNPRPGHSQTIQLGLNYKQDTGFPIGAYYLKSSKSLIESHPGIYQQRQLLNPINYQHPPRVAVFGAGNDSLPLCEIMSRLYWHGYTLDHREGQLATARFPKHWQCINYQANRLSTHLKTLKPDAIIIMSHNLTRDAECLAAATESNVPFIGLLGPKQRRDKILQLAQVELAAIEHQLKAPVGLDLGGRLPENIAISISSQLQKHFFKK